jgi:hypothetical protein
MRRNHPLIGTGRPPHLPPLGAVLAQTAPNARARLRRRNVAHIGYMLRALVRTEYWAFWCRVGMGAGHNATAFQYLFGAQFLACSLFI